MLRLRSLPLVLLIFFLIISTRSEALVINGYDPARNDRFVSGTYPNSPVSNPNFIGASYDWSGVGWDSSVYVDGMRSVTLVSPQHFVSANHWKLPVGGAVNFLNRSGQLKTYTVGGYSTFTTTDIYGTHTSDLALGWLTQPISESDSITYYPVVTADDPSTPAFEYQWFLNRELLVCGWYGRAGKNNIDGLAWAYSVPGYADLTLTYSFDYQNNVPAQDQAGVQPGDSGSPSFMVWNGRLTVLGTHFGVDGSLPDPSWVSYDAFIPYYLNDMNLAMATSGYSVDTIVAPEPSTCLLILSGLTGLFVLRRGKK